MKVRAEKSLDGKFPPGVIPHITQREGNSAKRQSACGKCEPIQIVFRTNVVKSFLVDCLSGKGSEVKYRQFESFRCGINQK